MMDQNKTQKDEAATTLLCKMMEMQLNMMKKFLEPQQKMFSSIPTMGIYGGSPYSKFLPNHSSNFIYSTSSPNFSLPISMLPIILRMKTIKKIMRTNNEFELYCLEEIK
jgi:hypothetical protein